jgi:hypothetical protein
MDHRWGIRTSIDAPLRLFSAATGEREGRLCNLSLSGALIRVDVELKLLTPVALVIGHTLSSIDAYVTRIGRDGIGVEWCEFSPTTVAKLLKVGMQDGCMLLQPNSLIVTEPALAPVAEHLRRAG